MPLIEPLLRSLREVALAAYLSLAPFSPPPLITAMLPEPEPATYYVDANLGSDSYSGRLADPDVHKTDGPLRTIQKAYDQLQPGDSLYIKKGVYPETLVLNKTATAERPILIQVFPGDEGKAVIDAADGLMNWTKCTSAASCDGNPNWRNIVYAEVGEEVPQVFQNGGRLKPSRTPDQGWLYPKAVDPNRATEVFYQASAPTAGPSLGHSTCHIKTRLWHVDQIRVRAYDPNRGEVVLESPARYPISPSYGYYFMHVVRDINEEGEWAYDSHEKRVYLWPRAGSLDTVKVTRRYYAIEARPGCSGHVIQGLVLKNAVEGIRLSGTREMTVRQLTVDYSYSAGICDVNGSQTRLIDNRIGYSCDFGIRDGGLSRDALIQGNTIYAMGAENVGDDLLHGVGYGIFIGGSRARVLYNSIDCTGYSGIYIWGDTSGREIACNTVVKACLSLSDGGGIYTGGQSATEERDTIHHNIIMDVFGYLGGSASYEDALAKSPLLCRGGAHGIYLDEQGDHRVFEDNTVIRGGDSGIFLHWTQDNRLARNTLFGNQYSQVLLVGRNDPRFMLQDNDLADNLLIATGPDQKTFQLNTDYSDIDFGEADGNLYYHPTTPKHIGVIWDAHGPMSASYSLREWQERSGKDLHSRDLSPQGSDAPARGQPLIRVNTHQEPLRIDFGGLSFVDVNDHPVNDPLWLEPYGSIVLFPIQGQDPS